MHRVGAVEPARRREANVAGLERDDARIPAHSDKRPIFATWYSAGLAEAWPQYTHKDPIFTSNPASGGCDRPARDLALSQRLVQLVERVQVLTHTRDELRARAGSEVELRAVETDLEQLRWRLAYVARRQAADELGNAA